MNPQTGLVVVADGMGSGTNSGLFAQSLVENIADKEDDVKMAAQITSRDMAKIPDIKGSGACFLSAKIEVGKPIDVHQCGDVDIFHFNSRGRPKYQAGQHIEMGKGAQSAFDYFEFLTQQKVPRDHLERHILREFRERGTEDETRALQAIAERISADQRPFVEKSNPLFEHLRRLVFNVVTSKRAKVIDYQTKQPVEAGDWIVVMSDGVTDILNEGELDLLMNSAIYNNWSPEKAMEELSNIVDERTRLRAENDPMAIKNRFKLDNATIVIMRVPMAEVAAEAA